MTATTIRHPVISCAGLALGLALAMPGCAPRLETPNDAPDGGAAPEEIDFSAGPVVHQDPGDGTTITHIEANNGLEWVYLDLESKAAVVPVEPTDSLDWDLSFQRFSFMINGGVSGTGDVAVAALPGQDFDSLTVAPAGDYITDQPDTPADQGGDANEDPDYALSTGDTQWYDYNSMTHVLTPRDIVYVLRSAEGSYYKLEVLGYYSAKGESGYPSFRWQAITPPG